MQQPENSSSKLLICLFMLQPIPYLTLFQWKHEIVSWLLNVVIFFRLISGETFSENFSHTEKCQACTQCTGLFRMDTPCTDSNDAICVCNYGYYFSDLSQKCEPCTKCPEGRGMYLSCEPDHDTICEECGGDTYSDQESSREPCIPCTTCDEEQVKKACTSVSDTVCQGQTIISLIVVYRLYNPGCISSCIF